MTQPFARVVGDVGAPWLVLCHGMALHHRDLLPVAEAAAARGWRALLWDMPGHGASRPAPADWSVAAMTDALERVMAASGAERAVLLGFSFGGMVAQEFARRYPDRVRALIAYACFAPHLVPAPRRLGRAIIALGFGWRSWPALQRDFARRCAVTAAAREQVVEAMQPLGKSGFLAIARSLLEGTEPDPGFRIDAPLLLIRGDKDSNGRALAKAAAALSAADTHAEQVLIPAAGHCAHLDAPKPFERAVLAFLASLEALPQKG